VLNGPNASRYSFVNNEFSVMFLEKGKLKEFITIAINGVNVEPLLLDEDGLEEGIHLYH
jgi:hypothetical protein